MHTPWPPNPRSQAAAVYIYHGRAEAEAAQAVALPTAGRVCLAALGLATPPSSPPSSPRGPPAGRADGPGPGPGGYMLTLTSELTARPRLRWVRVAGLAGRAVRTGRQIAVADAERDPRWGGRPSR